MIISFKVMFDTFFCTSWFSSTCRDYKVLPFSKGELEEIFCIVSKAASPKASFLSKNHSVSPFRKGGLK